MQIVLNLRCDRPDVLARSGPGRESVAPVEPDEPGQGEHVPPLQPGRGTLEQHHLLTAARSDSLYQAAADPELGGKRRGDLRERGRDQDGIVGARSGSPRLPSPASTSALSIPCRARFRRAGRRACPASRPAPTARSPAPDTASRVSCSIGGVSLPQLRITRVREHLVHAAASHHVAAQEQDHQPIAHTTHSARPPAARRDRRPAPKAPLLLLNAPANLTCARPPGQHQASRNRSGGYGSQELWVVPLTVLPEHQPAPGRRG
jgi:hypothetical protein